MFTEYMTLSFITVNAALKCVFSYDLITGAKRSDLQGGLGRCRAPRCAAAPGREFHSRPGAQNLHKTMEGAAFHTEGVLFLGHSAIWGPTIMNEARSDSLSKYRQRMGLLEIRHLQ